MTGAASVFTAAVGRVRSASFASFWIQLAKVAGEQPLATASCAEGAFADSSLWLCLPPF